VLECWAGVFPAQEKRFQDCTPFRHRARQQGGLTSYGNNTTR
jgi:hypothetical protein